MAHVLRMTQITTSRPDSASAPYIRTQEKNSGPHGDDFEPFVEMNWIHNSKDFAVSMNGVKVEQDGASNLGEIKLGVNGNLNPAASVWGMWACSWVIMATMTPQ
ncbi:autotransporter outer membrane beta-barrel domain-containing protein [Escherichia coli]|nr:autotransporter outer membrane beta-barrel domain-containing protein [Escherichia coli]